MVLPVCRVCRAHRNKVKQIPLHGTHGTPCGSRKDAKPAKVKRQYFSGKKIISLRSLRLGERKRRYKY
jgi:hypothetical protein